MKRSIILVLFIGVFSFNTYSQSQFWFGMGYNMSRFKLDNSINYVIDRYNQTRTGYLTKTMDNIHFTDGMALSFGFNNERFIYDLSYTGKRQTVSAQGNSTQNGNSQRDLRLKSKCFSMGLGYALLNSQTFSVSLCATIDMMNFKTETRVGEVSEIKKEDFEKISNDIDIGTTFYFQFLVGSARGKGLALLVRPYYQFNYIKLNFYDVNERINPNTYYNDSYYLEGRPSNIGLSLMLAIYGSH